MKLFKHAKAVSHFKDDPFGLIVDTLIRIIVNLIIPIPLAGEVVAQYKGTILGCFVSLILMGVFMIVILGTVVLTPFLATESFFQKLISPFITTTSAISFDDTFIQTDRPMQIPFGGHGIEYASVTAGFMDPSYFLKFGENHTGIDLVPNDNYYKNNESYKKNHLVVIYATNTGIANYYIDNNGGMTVENTNPEGTIKVLEIHMKQVFVKSGDSLKAGTPVGIMGMTGHATGEHVHYEIRVKQGNNWIAVNPLLYIK